MDFALSFVVSLFLTFAVNAVGELLSPTIPREPPAIIREADEREDQWWGWEAKEP